MNSMKLNLARVPVAGDRRCPFLTSEKAMAISLGGASLSVDESLGCFFVLIAFLQEVFCVILHFIPVVDGSD